MKIMMNVPPMARQTLKPGPSFGVSARFRDVKPFVELSGKTTSLPVIQELRKGATGTPQVRLIRNPREMNALNQALGTNIPVQFPAHAALVVTQDNAGQITRKAMNTDTTDPSGTLNVDLGSGLWQGVANGAVSVSYYIAVIPIDRSGPTPRVTLH